jgi:hypothetical protein
LYNRPVVKRRGAYQILAAALFFRSLLFHLHPALAGQGCCSSHGGVAGCSGANLQCRDGTVSPTCPCQDGNSNPHPKKAQSAIRNAQDYLGVPYKYGGTDKGGLDCSGTVDQAYSGHFPRRMSAADQYDYEENTLHEEGVPYDRLQPGDIAYWRSGDAQKISHTAIVEKVEGEGPNRTVTIINAPGRGKSIREQKLDAGGGLWGPIFAGGARPK